MKKACFPFYLLIKALVPLEMRQCGPKGVVLFGCEMFRFFAFRQLRHVHAACDLWSNPFRVFCLFVCFLRVLRPSFKRLSLLWPGKNWSNQNSDERGGSLRKRLLRRLGDVCSGGGGTQTSFHGKTCHVAKLALVNLTLTRFNLSRITCSPFTHEQLKLNKQNLLVWDRQQVSSAVT